MYSLHMQSQRLKSMCTEVCVQKIQDFPPSENNQSVLHDGRAGTEVPLPLPGRVTLGSYLT